jgi:transposase-like protein
MSEGELINLGLNKHLIECPHCKKQIVHNWPGEKILFAKAKCASCNREFVIAMNRPRIEP